jgi:hypothetical protein
VRNLAKLAVFFSLSFAILFIAATGLRFLAIRVEWVRTLSLERETVLLELISAARWALSLTLYGGIILGLGLSVNYRVFAPLAILCIAVLSIGFVGGIGLALENWEYVPPERTPTPSLGEPGVILANTTGPSGTVLVLLEGSAKPGGARVVATPGKPLLYQAEFAGRDQALISLPPAPFTDNVPWFLKSLAIDVRLNAENLKQRLNDGLFSFLIYVGALIFLLCSFMFLQNFSVWRLANLFLTCLAFRGILVLETFFNSPEMLDAFDSFLQGRLSLWLVIPSIFVGVGFLIYLYSILVYVTRRQIRDAV